VTGSGPSVSCVVLTMGDRPVELARAVDSVLAQRGEPVEVLVLGNGADPGELPPGVRAERLPTNLGIPGGRNAGVERTAGEIVLFLDDDGCYPDPGLVEHVRRAFVDDPALGILGLRIEDPDGAAGARRHVPRLRAGDPLRSSAVTTFLGGAAAVRREVFARCGGLPAHFGYAHEETDLAWRALDAGYRIRYDAAAVMAHPAGTPTRHAQFYRLNARNRVWLARRNLPWPLAAAYLLDWTVLTLARTRSPAALRTWFAGFAEGWTTPAGPRQPIRWRTAWRMTLAGRPPIV